MLLNFLTIVAAVFVASAAFCGSVVGSKHDFSTLTGTGTTGTTLVCTYCHMGHKIRSFEALWTGDPNVFRLYSGIAMASVSFKSGFTADSPSLYCLSCHDGGGANGVRITTIIGPANLGTNFSKAHPVNFQVTEINKQKDLWVGGGAYTGKQMGRLEGKPFPLFKVSGNRGGERALECGSCHDAHNAEFSPFLRDTLTRSKLCFGCHDK